MFVLHTCGAGGTPALEYLPVSAIAPRIGLAMTMEEGLLAPASGANAPTYICMTERETACQAGELIPVVRVQHGIVFETTFSVDAAAVKLGDKLTIADDGMQVTATAGGAAEVVGVVGTAKGDAVRVRF